VHSFPLFLCERASKKPHVTVTCTLAKVLCLTCAHWDVQALVNGYMWRNILVQSIYQLAVQIFLLVQGTTFLTDCTWNKKTGNQCVPLHPNGQGKNHAGNYRDTVIYNAFVWCQIFNEINARRIYNEKNQFEGILSNSIFMGIIVISCFVQFCSVEYGGEVFKTVPIDFIDWAFCIGVGAFSLVLGWVQRFLPPADWIVDMFSAAGSGEDDDSGHDMKVNGRIGDPNDEL